MSLHGYGGDIRECPPAPSLACITTEENKDRLETMMNLLFCTSNNEFLSPGGALRRFVDSMLAVQFIHFEECEAMCEPPQTDIITDTILSVALSLAFTRIQIIEWGKKIYLVWLAEVDRIAGLKAGSRDVFDQASATLNRIAENTNTLNKIEADVQGLVFSGKKMQVEIVELKNTMDEIKKTTSMTYDLIKAIASESSTSLPVLNAASIPVASTVSTASSVTTSSGSGRNAFTELLSSSGIDHKTIFNHGAPNKMTADNFVSSVTIYNINIRSSKPFSFKISPQLRVKLGKIVHYMHKQMSAASIDRVNLLKRDKEENGSVAMTNRTEIRDIYRGVASELLIRLIEDMVKYNEYNGATAKKKRNNRVQDEYVGSMVTKIEKLETQAQVCLTDPARRRFYE